MNPPLWSERHGNHLFVYWRGVPIYKNYDSKEASVILDKKGWPNERIY